MNKNLKRIVYTVIIIIVVAILALLYVLFGLNEKHSYIPYCIGIVVCIIIYSIKKKKSFE